MTSDNSYAIYNRLLAEKESKNGGKQVAYDSFETDESFWDKLSEAVKQGFKAGKTELLRTSRMGKIRLEISAIKSRIGSKQRELGFGVYKLWRANKIELGELEGTCLEISRLKEQISEKEKEIDRLIEEKEREKREEISSLAEEPVRVALEPEIGPGPSAEEAAKKTSPKKGTDTGLTTASRVNQVDTDSEADFF